MNSTQKTTGKIRIIKVPDGPGIPEWVRECWLNLVLPCYPIMGPAEGGERDTKGNVIPSRFGVSVPQEEALKILGWSSLTGSRAEEWFRSKGFPNGECFGFDESEVEIIDGVTRAEIKMFPDMEGPSAGDMFP